MSEPIRGSTARASRHEPQIREFSIEPEGIVMGAIAPYGGDRRRSG
ncbi:MAG TPA: hypothetical protein VET24_08070 [Actinomycetota bacterium]|nr:hypothetical protein [Actinomycetota bacterium]